MITKHKLLQNYKEHLAEELAQVDTDLDELEGEGPEYEQDDINSWVWSQLGVYRYEYDESDLLDEIGQELMEVEASDRIDEERRTNEAWDKLENRTQV